MGSIVPGTSKDTQGEGWIPLLTLFTIASMIEAGFWNQMNVFTPLFLPQLGIDHSDVKGWTGAIAAITSIVGLPFLPFWGALADRYSRQPVIVRSFVAHLLSGIIAMLAGNIWIFIIGRSMSSFSLGNSGLMMTTLSERMPPGRTGLAFSIMSGGSPLGAFLGPLAGGPVVDRWGFQALMAIDSVIMLGLVLAMTFGYRDTFVGTNRGSLLKMAGGSVGIITRSPRLRSLFPALFVLFAGWMLTFTFIALMVQAIYKGADLGTVTGIVVGLGGLGTLIIGPLFGALADRFGHWNMLFIGSGVAVLLWPLPYFTRELFAFCVLWVLINGVSSGLFAVSFSVLSSSCTVEERGRVMAFAYLPANAGAFFGATLGGLLISTQFLPTEADRLFFLFPVASILTALGLAALLYSSKRDVNKLEGALAA